jgi:esterase/lipase superfamily enzyme
MPFKGLTVSIRTAAAALLLIASVGLARADIDFVLMGKVRYAVSQGHLTAAADLLARALDQLDDIELEEREALLRELADIQIRAGLHAEAATTLQRVAELAARRLDDRHPDLSGVHELAGDEYLRAGNLQAAIHAFERAIEVDREHLSAGHPLVIAALERLSELYGSIADNAGAAQITQQIQFAQVIGDRTTASYSPRAEEIDAGYGDVDDDSLARIRIFYATDRARSGVARPNDFYSVERGGVDYGTVLVSIPRAHRPGQVEEPFSRWNRENPQRHIVLLTLTTMNRDEAFTEMRAQTQSDGTDEAFVFVHGYNLSFAEAARRTAQISYDLNFAGLPIMYSWPSRDNLYDYISDSEEVSQSSRALEAFLEDVVARSGASRVHLIAHGMGNRALAEALELYALRHAAEGAEPPFEQVVFAAPDMDAGRFAGMVETIAPVAKRLTLYASSSDAALTVPRELFGDRPRAGETGESILVAQGIDTIVVTDAAALTAYNAALGDMLSLFWDDAAPGERCGLEPQRALDGAYWSYSEDACGGATYVSALTLLRDKGADAAAFAAEMIIRWRDQGDARAVQDWETIQAHVARLSSR